MKPPEKGELDCRIDVKKVATYIASIQFFLNSLKREFDKAGLTADLKKYEEEYKKDHNIGENQ